MGNHMQRASEVAELLKEELAGKIEGVQKFMKENNDYPSI